MKSSGRGFTLVELLVVIAIIAVLVALFLPAVQSARESGRQSTCANNLKQLGIACQQHVSTHGWFPTGGWGNAWYGLPGRGYTLKQPGGWVYNVLSYIDQDNLRQQGAATIPTNNVGAGTNVFAPAGWNGTTLNPLGPPLASLLCPSRRSAATLTSTRTDYGANMGTGANWWPPGEGAGPSYSSGYPSGTTGMNDAALVGGPDTTAIGDALPLPNSQNGPNNPSDGSPPPSPPWTGSPCPLYAAYTKAPPTNPPSAPPNVLWPPDPFPPMPIPAPGETPPPPPSYPAYAKQGNMCWPDWTTGGVAHNAAIANGVIFLRSQITPAQVTDGLSNTVMLGEKSVAAPYNGTSSWDATLAFVGHAPDTERAMAATPPVPDSLANGSYFGSAHTGGALLVFCDGSVHMISFSADPTTCGYLGGRNEHKAIDPSKLGL